MGSAAGHVGALPPEPVVALPPEPVVRPPPEPVVALPPEPVMALPPAPVVTVPPAPVLPPAPLVTPVPLVAPVVLELPPLPVSIELPQAQSKSVPSAAPAMQIARGAVCATEMFENRGRWAKKDIGGLQKRAVLGLFSGAARTLRNFLGD